MPLAVAILLRDYRFALADIFLKRALTLTLVVVAVATAHVTIGLRWLGPDTRRRGDDLCRRPGAGDGAAAGTGRAFGAWVVDTVVLRRPDTSTVVRAVEAELSAITEPDAIPVVAAARLGAALDAAWIERAKWSAGAAADLAARVLAGAEAASIRRGREDAPAGRRRSGRAAQGAARGVRRGADGRGAAARLVRRSAHRRPALALGRRGAGRVGRLHRRAPSRCAARRRRALRAALRERQIGQLATEAELRALRAQLNPHFLFNALTTIGYLIQVAPRARAEHADAAHQPAARRAAAQHTEFSRLGDEIALVQAYLEIEEARFEERLRVRIVVDAALHEVLIPSLLLQPLVENAVKHGIAPLAAGGEVEVRAGLAGPASRRAGHAARHGARLRVGHAAPGPFDPPGEGLGLANVAQRLRATSATARR